MSLHRIKTMYPDMSEDDFSYVLWEWTAYPMGDIKTVVRQFRSKIRAAQNKRKICWFCACDVTLKHKSYCPTWRGEKSPT